MKAAISNYFRAKRFGFFKALLDGMLQTQKKVKILDIGGTEDYWKNQGLVLGDQIEIVLLNLYKAEVSTPGFTSIKGDATNLEGIADKSFDLVYSNSVIEHLFSLEQQEKMAKETIRVGKSYFIQTPNKYFPIEPHWVFPFFQFLPFGLQVFLTQHFNLGHIPKAKNKEAAISLVKEVRLLSKKEFTHLFKGSMLYTEKFLGLNKSFAVYQIEK
jgi:hypothetical protein